MFRSRRVLVLMLGGFLALGVYADDKPVRTIKGWGDLINPDEDCEVLTILTPGDQRKVRVKLPGVAHDFAAELQRWNAPRILSEVSGDFIIDVQVSGEFKPDEESTIPTRRSYNGAGLLLVKDRNNYVSIHRGAVNLGNRVRQYANFELRKDAELSVSLFQLELEDKETYLRLERHGNKICGMAGYDGIHWRSYEPIEVDFPQDLSVGIEAVNSSKQPFTCVLKNLALYRKVDIAAGKP